MVVGGAVVVVEVEAVPEIGRTGAMGTGVGASFEDVEEDDVELRVGDGEFVIVDVVDVVSVCVEVETDVEASATELLLLVEDDLGEAVTVGLIMTVAVDWTWQPSGTQL